MKKTMNKKRVFAILLGIASLMLTGYIIVTNLMRFVPDLHSARAIDLFFEFAVLLVMAAAIPISVSAIRGRKLCFLRGFAVLYTIYNILVLVFNLFSMVHHVYKLFQFSFGAYDILYTLAMMLPGLIKTGLSVISGALLFLGVQQKKRPFLIAAVCLAAAAFMLHLIEWRMVFHFFLLYVLTAVLGLLNEGE